MSRPLALVTGGAGFIGSHLVDALLARGFCVRVLDNLDPQVHSGNGVRSRWLSREAELMVGDVRDVDAIARALNGAEIVYHLAAAVGVGQSMYRISEYTAANTLGTANLLQTLIDRRIELQRLVVASSMSIYGEGRYERTDGRDVGAVRRTITQLTAKEWEARDRDGAVLIPRPTNEQKALDPTSIYALTKADQEKMVLQIGAAYDIPSVALRFFNVYGPRQALSNPYTGVVAIFLSRLLNGKPPLIFEDGEQRRDFVSIHDVVRSLLAAVEHDGAAGEAINIASGRSVTIGEVARTLARVLDSDIEPQITERYRVGDVRHCTADISRAEALLDYAPRVALEEGFAELATWLKEQEKPDDGVEMHVAELASHGLTR